MLAREGSMFISFDVIVSIVFMLMWRIGGLQISRYGVSVVRSLPTTGWSQASEHEIKFMRAFSLQVEPLISLDIRDVVNGGAINGDYFLDKLDEASSSITDINADELMPLSPPMSYSKFLTMQEKRAVVTIRYSGDAGLKPYFLTMAKKIKASHPDVIVERRILPAVVDGEATFEVLVDNKVIIGKSRHRKAGRGVEMPQNTRRSVFVSMSEMDQAISRARRKQRPTTAYGGDDEETKKASAWLDE